MFLLLYSCIIAWSILSQRKDIKKNVTFSKTVISNIKMSDIGIGLLSIFTVLTVSLLLILTGNPVLQWGWLTSLASGIEDIAASHDTTVHDTHNTSIVSYIAPVFIIVVMSVFMVQIPYYAYLEEVHFRGKILQSSNKDVIKNSFVFGFMHLIVGIPVAVAIALSFSGMIFAYTARYHFNKMNNVALCYVSKDDTETIDNVKNFARDNALLQSTSVHTVHNICAVSIILLSIVIAMLI